MAEGMTDSNRKEMLQGLTDEQLCRGYNNQLLGEQTERQILELLRTRGVAQCVALGRTRTVTATSTPQTTTASLAAAATPVSPVDAATAERERRRVLEEAKKLEADRVSAENRAAAEARVRAEEQAQRDVKEKEQPRPDDESSVMQELFGPLSPDEIVKIKTVRPANSIERPRITQAVQRSLNDPESARFGDIFVLPNKHACVAVNAKNKFGGYAGTRMAFAGTFNGTWQPLGMHDVTLEKCISMIVKLK
ncbi:MAG: hypothetical protein U1E12_14735 [Hydrogenophaga sp.]|uniref:hypothetical protein n=1 Tax=Hydrogenophaga sp. TaxID=1904254 RepID=UPI002ABA2A6D|nr:hypothetical protein [Hydrogenophaga sp.]MDZ4102927.1 hypothetical protein [Hydrogenophaga sp.]